MRPSFDQIWMRVARVVAERATCDRKHVGAVLVSSSNRVLATGYNGAPRGMPHCDDVGHQLKEVDGRLSCVRTLHAESNALDQAGLGNALGATLYVTCKTCYPCAQRAVNAGVKRIVFGEFYASQNTDLVDDLLARAGVKLEMLPVPDPGAIIAEAINLIGYSVCSCFPTEPCGRCRAIQTLETYQ